MSQKWRRSQAWDEANIPRAMWPVKAILRTFSSIWLAVILLSMVALYGIVASVPIGILAKAPTYLIYLVTILLAIGVVGVGPAAGWWFGLRRFRGARFVLSFATLLAGGVAGVWLWREYAWPRLAWDGATKSGFMLFADFVERTGAITLRRLPGMEMSEMEFYGWWPLRVILMTFIVNMVVATVRRIEFNFKNIGVLTVHTGIITIALGSIYYNGLKQEGDTLLQAGRPDPQTGEAQAGPPQRYFFDNTRVSLFVRQIAPEVREGEQRPLTGVPRYNDYGLNAMTGETASALARRAGAKAEDDGRTLNVPVMKSTRGRVDPDIEFALVGYAAYADEKAEKDWLRVDAQGLRTVPAGGHLNPLRIVNFLSALPDEKGTVREDPVFIFTLPPLLPAERSTGNSVFSVEYTMGNRASPWGGMPEWRWQDLCEKLPPGTLRGLVVEIARDNEPPFRGVYPVREGDKIVITETGWTIDVQQLADEPPFPIITEGYKDGHSGMAVLKVTPPANRLNGRPFDRWVYHRFPEISQDLLEEKNDRGMPKRRNADPAIRINLIEANRLNVYFDESQNGDVRAIIREPGGAVRIIDKVEGDLLKDIVPKISMKVAARWDHATRIEHPKPVPPADREKEFVGTHDKAMLAVEVKASGGFRQVVWLPFAKYLGIGMGTERVVELPDGRSIELNFGRRQYPFPDFEIELLNFEMLAYDHRGAPRDYQSLIRVLPRAAKGEEPAFEAYEHITQLNSPLQAPFMWDEKRNIFGNIAGSFVRGISPRHFKLSQAGWDRGTWMQTQKQVDQGLLKKPFVSFTILGVGNNPGIHIIAAGAVMMALGIPWAFYLKPYLVRREKKRIQEQLAAGTYKRPGTGEASVERGERELVGAQG